MIGPMTSALHDARLATDAPRASIPIDDGRDDSAALIDAIVAAAAAKTPLVIRGGGSKRWLGHRIDGHPLDVRRHAGIVDYEPSELVIVARAGTPLADIEALLTRHRQMLAFEPPGFAAGAGEAIARAMTGATPHRAVGATLGGTVSAGLSGPRRMAAGAVRDFVLGARLIDGRGRHLSFGGRVMKNVAGYDVSRVLAGSMGMLGVITEVSMKVMPMPTATATLALAVDERTAIDRMNEWAGLPIAITATAWTSAASTGSGYQPRGGRLLVRLEGSEAAVQSGIRRIGGSDIDADDAQAFWRDAREQTDAFFGLRPVDVPLWRVALPSDAPPLDAATLGFQDQRI
jgi:glycolate oxidase FAD binding subunit